MFSQHIFMASKWEQFLATVLYPLWLNLSITCYEEASHLCLTRHAPAEELGVCAFLGKGEAGRLVKPLTHLSLAPGFPWNPFFRVLLKGSLVCSRDLVLVSVERA